MAPPRLARPGFDLCSGHLALDLANTKSERQADAPIERLHGVADLVRFARQTKLVSAGEAARLRAWARASPSAARALFRRAVALREALYRMFAAHARGRRPDRSDLDLLNRELARVCLGQRFDWTWHTGASAPDAMLGRLARAAADLMTSARREHVRICEAHDCVWLFLDHSKNGSRRWCDMKQCGNRAKARRHYQRHHNAPEGAWNEHRRP